MCKYVSMCVCMCVEVHLLGGSVACCACQPSMVSHLVYSFDAFVRLFTNNCYYCFCYCWYRYIWWPFFWHRIFALQHLAGVAPTPLLILYNRALWIALMPLVEAWQEWSRGEERSASISLFFCFIVVSRKVNFMCMSFVLHCFCYVHVFSLRKCRFFCICIPQPEVEVVSCSTFVWYLWSATIALNCIAVV